MEIGKSNNSDDIVMILVIICTSDTSGVLRMGFHDVDSCRLLSRFMVSPLFLMQYIYYGRVCLIGLINSVL